MKYFKTSLGVVIAITATGIGCESNQSQKTVRASSAHDSGLELPPLQVDFSIQLLDSAKSVPALYDEQSGNGSLTVERGGKSYYMYVNTLNSDASFELSIPGRSPIQLAGQQYTLIQSPNDVGNLPVTVTASAPGVPSRSKNYVLAVTCDAAESAGFEVNEGSLVVSGSMNRYSYSVSGSPASGGVGPFRCAFDFNGDGIRDSDYANCSNARQEYSNHVYSRNVGLFVRDEGCNMSKSKSRSVVLSAPDYAGIRALAPNLFITGTVSSPQRSSDPRLNLQHLSTNPPGMSPAPVQCNYSRSNGNGTFTIAGYHQYSTTTAKRHGISLRISNLEDNVDILAGSGSIDASSARISRVNFDSDEAPDLASQHRFQASNGCTVNVTMTPLEIAGSPCSGGQSGINGGFTVEAEGTFSCSGVPALTANGLSVDINQGAFYCLFRYADQCVGGGGGGGGVPPIEK